MIVSSSPATPARERAWPSLSRLVLWCLGVALLAGADVVHGQEAQVPFDPAGRVMVVDERLGQQLQLFVDEYPGFVEARLFQAAGGGGFALEVLVRRGDSLLRERVPLTGAEAAALRTRVGERLAGVASPAQANQEARFLLLAGSTALGLGLYGWALPVALNVHDGKVFTGLYMLTASASFFGPWVATQRRSVTPAIAELTFYGGSRGFLHGGMLHYLVTGGPDRQLVCDERGFCYEEDDDSRRRGAIGAGVLVGAAEAIAGYRWASRSGMNAGTANAITNGGDFGMLGGFGTAAVLDLDDDEDPRAWAALGLAGNAGGIVGGRMLAARRDFSYGDVEVVTTAGWTGVFVTASLLDLAGVDESRQMVAGAMAGGLAGIVLGDRLVRDTNFTFGQATLVRLGTVAGTLLGLGTGVLLESEDGDGTMVTTAAAVGSLAGFGVTYRVVAPAARRGGGLSSALELQIGAPGLFRVASAEGLPSLDVPLPLLGASYRF